MNLKIKHTFKDSRKKKCMRLQRERFWIRPKQNQEMKEVD